jgi:hypothetical protein
MKRETMVLFDFSMAPLGKWLHVESAEEAGEVTQEMTAASLIRGHEGHSG